MGKANKIIVNEKEYVSEKEMCKDLELDYNKYKNRKYRGWTLEEQIQGFRNGKNVTTYEIDREIPIITDYRFTFNSRAIYSPDELFAYDQIFSRIKRINLIDYENVSDNRLLIENHISDPDTINIFFFNACIYSNNYYNLARNIKGYNFQIMTMEASDQLIDRLLLFYLGVIASRYPDKYYKIFSRDNGFNPVVNNIRYSNINMANLNKQTKHGYKYNLAKYILNHGDITQSKYYYRSDFRRLFVEFYQGKKFNSHTVNNLITELLRFDFIDSMNISGSTQYRFNIKHIKKYLKKIDE